MECISYKYTFKIQKLFLNELSTAAVIHISFFKCPYPSKRNNQWFCFTFLLIILAHLLDGIWGRRTFLKRVCLLLVIHAHLEKIHFGYNILKDEVLLTVSCPIFPSILIAKNLITGSLKNRSIDNLETQKKFISMKNSQFFDYLLYAKSK